MKLNICQLRQSADAKYLLIYLDKINTAKTFMKRKQIWFEVLLNDWWG